LLLLLLSHITILLETFLSNFCPILNASHIVGAAGRKSFPQCVDGEYHDEDKVP